MSDVFFESLSMREPDYNLNIGSGRHGEMTGKIMISLEDIMIDEAPDIVLLYGDTNSTLAGAIVGAKLKIPVAHVEAGLRQDPKDMPEEINRVLTDHASKYLFCPSLTGVENLAKEGIKKNVFFSGDVMYDLFLLFREKFDSKIATALGLEAGKYIVVTLHRDFNVDRREPLKLALASLARIAGEMPVIFPMHPRTRKRIAEFGLEDMVGTLKITEPLGYMEIMGLVESSYAVVTDSGGLQKEAYFAGKRAVILMEDTGWRELVDCGWNALAKAEELYDRVLVADKPKYPACVYGDGNAAKKIVDILKP